jgi:hypothetical protein
MNTKLLLLGFLYFLASSILIWFQSHVQFFNAWAKSHPFLIAVPGVFVSYVSILATKYITEAYDGLVWPSRLIGFGIGIEGQTNPSYASVIYFVANIET